MHRERDGRNFRHPKPTGALHSFLTARFQARSHYPPSWRSGSKESSNSGSGPSGSSSVVGGSSSICSPLQGRSSVAIGRSSVAIEGLTGTYSRNSKNSSSDITSGSGQTTRKRHFASYSFHAASKPAARGINT